MREHRRHHLRHILPLGRLKINFINENSEKNLKITEKDMKYQMEMFSRTFRVKHYANAWKIFTELRKKGFAGNIPLVTTWELYDKAWIELKSE